jgi:hypothetical protein
MGPARYDLMMKQKKAIINMSAVRKKVIVLLMCKH